MENKNINFDTAYQKMLSPQSKIGEERPIHKGTMNVS